MSKRAQTADVERGWVGGVECGEGLGVQAVMRDGAVQAMWGMVNSGMVGWVVGVWFLSTRLG